MKKYKFSHVTDSNPMTDAEYYVKYKEHKQEISTLKDIIKNIRELCYQDFIPNQNETIDNIYNEAGKVL